MRLKKQGFLDFFVQNISEEERKGSKRNENERKGTKRNKREQEITEKLYNHISFWFRLRLPIFKKLQFSSVYGSDANFTFSVRLGFYLTLPKMSHYEINSLYPMVHLTCNT